MHLDKNTQLLSPPDEETVLQAEAAFSLAAPPDHLLVVALSHAASNPGRLDLFISEMTEKRVDEGKTVKMAQPAPCCSTMDSWPC